MEYMQSLPDGCFELAVVDPPYGIGVSKMGYTKMSNTQCRQKNGTYLTVKNQPYKERPWDNSCPPKEYFDELFRVSKNQIIWGVNYFPYNFLSGGRIVWCKLNGKNSFSDAELAYCSLHSTVKQFNYLWSGMFQGKSYLEGTVQRGNKKLNEKRIHPTQKPIELYKWILATYAKPGDKILDTHGGSFSSAIAAHIMGYNMTVVELMPEYYQSATERLKQYQNSPPPDPK